MRGLRVWMMVLALLGGALLFACGGDGDDADGGGVDQPTATAEADGGDGGADGGQDTDGGGDASSAIRDLEGKLATKEVKVAYNYTSTASGTTDQGTFTLYTKPPDWRFDFESGGSTGSIISAGGESYFCTPEDGGTCIKSSALTQVPLPFLSAFTDPESLSTLIGADLAGVNIDRSSRTIGGQDADCFKASGSASGEQGSGEFCFSSDGVLLSLTASSAGGEFSLEATSIEGSVSDADFEPPYEVLDIGAP